MITEKEIQEIPNASKRELIEKLITEFNRTATDHNYHLDKAADCKIRLREIKEIIEELKNPKTDTLDAI